MIAYKGFNPDLTCRGFQYAEGEIYETKHADVYLYSKAEVAAEDYILPPGEWCFLCTSGLWVFFVAKVNGGAA